MSVHFYCLGVHNEEDVMAQEKTDVRNYLTLKYSAVNSIIQASVSKINFGIKVADANYKQNVLLQPVHHKELFVKL